MIELNIQETLNFISNDEINSYRDKIKEANNSLYNKTGKGNDFLGWLDLPSKTSGDLLKSINETADRLASISDIIVVIGIGGSYLGARAVIDALSGKLQ